MRKHKMSMRNKNLLFNVIIFVVTIGLVMLAAILAGEKEGSDDRFLMILLFICGAIVSGILHVLVHELGHIIAGKKNDMELISVRFFCFEFKKKNGKLKFNWSTNLVTAGETVLIPKTCENVKKRYASVAMGGIMASIILAVIGIAGIALVKFLPLVAFAFTSMILPITAYNLLSNALPMCVDGAMNDGMVVDGAKHDDDTVTVASKILEVESQLLQGKTYGEVDTDSLFAVPQLPEDDLVYVVLLTNRYYYYLDRGEKEEALKVSNRIFSLLGNMPKYMKKEVKKNFLYDSCFLHLNENEADDLAEEVQGVLNKDNSARGLRIKASYLKYVLHDEEKFETFSKMALKKADKEQIKGIGLSEKKLIQEMIDDKN